MKAVILAGGVGSRLMEETASIPKPMVEIGGYPIIWHIMKIISFSGINEFVICGGYKSHVIKKYFVDYHLLNSSVSVSTSDGSTVVSNTEIEDWNVTIVDTGLESNTGERLRRVLDFVGDEFLLAYGDTLMDIDVAELINFHRSRVEDITVTVMREADKSGRLTLDANDKVATFAEKSLDKSEFVNRGFFVISKACFDQLTWPVNSSWEFDVFPLFVGEGRVSAYRHKGFGQPMDTLKEKNILENLWKNGAPWNVWRRGHDFE